jgi:type VI secretion system protein ImpG
VFGAREQPLGYWHAVRRQSAKVGDEGTEVYLSVSQPGSDGSLSDETLAVDITCTNRDLPSSLEFTFKFGDLPGSDNRVQYRVLQRPTRTARPPLDHRLDWRLVSHLGLNYVGLTSHDSAAGAAALRELLSLHDFSSDEGIKNRIASVAHASAAPTRARLSFKRGTELVPVFCHGLAVDVNLREYLLASTGTFLFSTVLERFFAAYCSLNSFTQLTVTVGEERRTLKQWPPRAGTQPLM